MTGRKEQVSETAIALQQADSEFIDFFENAPIPLHLIGPDGIIQRVNQAELDLLGYTQSEYVGRHIREFHVDQTIIDDMLHRLANGETLINYEAQLRHKDGSVRYVLINSNVRWVDGRFVHTRCFTRDITDKKLAEQEHARRALKTEDQRQGGLGPA
jgi:PAS domain S-box-containing protein